MTATDLLLTVLVLGVTVIAISVDVGAAVDLARRWAMKKARTTLAKKDAA